MTTALVYTDAGVVNAPVIDREQLDAVGLWLCQTKTHCDPEYQSAVQSVGSDRAHDRWEKQSAKNGGYCDICRDFAGEMLSKFDLKEKEQ